MSQDSNASIELSDWISGLPPVNSDQVHYKCLDSEYGVYYTVVPTQSLILSGVNLQADNPGVRLTEIVRPQFPNNVVKCEHDIDSECCMICSCL